MVEENLKATAKSIKKQIKVKLLERDISQIELAEMIHENTSQVSRAISGDISPKSIKIRERIYFILNIKE
ncbi:helix-turn-helix domain-containing protein [Loigolactobacillus backii]|uniref:transcriptional regulator n=1 Tax=Loigolactobacillus backii TaxID=375175 RepID=UPI0007F0F7C5|nr:transcriptional regulator [Loigolactobacillus backii]ANK66561.1 transcriptional regulator [Loigolactobacillus backii]OLF70785.1 hypothetical protein ACX53_00215 [Loigolactobacillus backii]PIO87272.1 transcriptional regulator [Loigolactobacillus backii]